ncbi:MAG TPA: hypothetical protein VNZ54_10800, partial [bacterium]|nr:hypothetical protein [bacterium]
MRKSWILFLLGTFGLAAPLWAGAPPLSFSFGPVNPGAQIAAAGGVTTFLQFTVTNNSTENVDLTSFSFQASGTADDAGTNLALYLDANQDGVPDGGALASQPFSVDNGALGLSFTTQVLAPGASQTFLVQGGGWSTLGTAVRSLTGVVATGETTTLASVNSGLPLTSSVVTVVPPPALVQAPGPSNPGWNTVTAGTGVQVLVLQFTLSNTASESVNLAGIQIQGAGTGNETLLGSVRLWEDLGPDGMDGSDLPLDTENYAADNGLVTLN